MKDILIYTDGACSQNPGPGGWCAILMWNNYKKIISGSALNTTNNRMEITAVLEGLRALKEKCNVKVFSDSAYVVNAFNSHWIDNWQNKNWSGVKNADLWKDLLKLTKEHNVSFIKVKGHSDNEYNNLCDRIAVSEYKKLQF